MQPTLMMFVKAPIPGRVKTRMCPPLSAQQAARLYRAFAADTLATAHRVRYLPPIACHIAYEPHPQAADPSWLGKGFSWNRQQGADLGARLTHATAAAFATGADPVVIIGSDTPDLPATAIAEAFDALRRHQLVLGPAADGGYYLIGLRRPIPQLFRAVDWSTGRVFAQTIAQAQALRLTVACLVTRRDLDTWSDVVGWRKTLRGSGALHTRRQLAAWEHRRGTARRRLPATASRGTVKA